MARDAIHSNCQEDGGNNIRDHDPRDGGSVHLDAILAHWKPKRTQTLKAVTRTLPLGCHCPAARASLSRECSARAERDQGLSLPCCLTQGSGTSYHVSPAVGADGSRASEWLATRQRERQAMALSEPAELPRGHRVRGSGQLSCAQAQPSPGAARNHPQTLGNQCCPQKSAWVKTPSSSGSRKQVGNTYFDSAPAAMGFASLLFHKRRRLWDHRKLNPSPAPLRLLPVRRFSAI